MRGNVLLLWVFTQALLGCVVPAYHHGPPPPRAKAYRRCHPSEYWDGDMCRHKGKGQGARKHDHPSSG